MSITVIDRCWGRGGAGHGGRTGGGCNPVVIDIEGTMYFDVEREHFFLRIRLHDACAPLAVEGLDEDRLALYLLAQRLSLTAGPLRLLDGDFPDRAFMAGIAEQAHQSSSSCRTRRDGWKA